MKIKYEVVQSGIVLRVYDNCIGITQKGFWGWMHKGASGERFIYYKDLTSITFKEAGNFTGFIEFHYPGSETKGNGSIFTGVLNDNRFTFGGITKEAVKKINDEMTLVKNYIQFKIDKVKQAPSTNMHKASIADELVKLKKLLDEGVLTLDEFNSQKRKLLEV